MLIRIISFIVLFSCIITTSSFGQVKLGVTGGMNVSSIKFNGPSLPNESVTGIFAGVLARYPVTEKLNIALAAQYSEKGFGIGRDTITQYKIGYIDFIPQIEYHLVQNLWIGAGLNFAFKLDEKTKLNIEDTWKAIGDTDFLSKTDAGLKIFARFFILKSLNVSVAINTGISDIEAYSFTDQDGNLIIGKQLNRNVQLGLGYTFGGMN